jgi:hypothetical protein
MAGSTVTFNKAKTQDPALESKILTAHMQDEGKRWLDLDLTMSCSPGMTFGYQAQSV